MLPKEITPSPILFATVEIRYTSTNISESLLSEFYPLLGNDLPKIRNSNIPAELKEKNVSLRFTPDFNLSNDDFSVAFGTNSIAFGIVNGYKLWDNYYSFIKNQLEKISQTQLVKNINRISLRYASLFEDINSFEKSLKYYPRLEVPGFTENVEIFRTKLSNANNTNFLVQLAPNANVARDNIQKTGVYIDIDASKDISLESIDNTLIDLIDKLHTEEKELFFNLLDNNFLANLNSK
jgi:uncharacterized protein (TIGR04255 family)